jgi:adenine-specific DNA methylase
MHRLAQSENYSILLENTFLVQSTSNFNKRERKNYAVNLNKKTEVNHDLMQWGDTPLLTSGARNARDEDASW